MSSNARNRRYRSATAVLVALAVILGLTACGVTEQEEDEGLAARRARRSEETIRIVYPPWSSEIASAHLFRAVLTERLGYRVELIPVEAEQMWSRVADGEADVLTGAWLPTTHGEYAEQYADRLEDLGPNLNGARIGLVVPTVTPGRRTDDTGRTGRPFVTIDSIEGLADTRDEFGGRIIGIESGAGVVTRAHEALEAYELGALYDVVETDEEHMLERLSAAVRRDEWIVLTGWKPHWMFELFNLRFLDDPRGVFGEEESIHTMVREGFAEELPDAHTVLGRISYEPNELERLMRWIREDDTDDPYGQALRWLEVHPDTVDDWVKGVE